MTEGPQKRLSKLRGLLYLKPGEATWRRLCRAVEQWPEDEELAVGLAYIEGHLESWPDAWRRVPQRWVDRLAKNRPAARPTPRA